MGKWKWTKDPKNYSEEDKRRILAKVVEIMTLTTFTTHFYTWKGKIYKQAKGGAIGVRATGSIAKVAMEAWIKRLESLLTAARIQVHLLCKYVDDVLAIVGSKPLGSRWVKGEIKHIKEWEAQDRAGGRSSSDVTYQSLKDCANSITP